MDQNIKTRVDIIEALTKVCEGSTFSQDFGVEPEITPRMNRVTVAFGDDLYVTFELGHLPDPYFDSPQGDTCVKYTVTAYVNYASHGNTRADVVADRADLLHKVALWASKIAESFPQYAVVVATKADKAAVLSQVKENLAREYTDVARKGLRAGKTTTFTLALEGQHKLVAEALADGPVFFRVDARCYRLEKPWDRNDFLLTRTALELP